MNLYTLKMFVATAEVLNFRRAAESEFISQPSLSRRIAGLERELGVKLFARVSRGVQLTEAGRTMLVEARDLLDRADQATALVRGIASREHEVIRVGTSGTVGTLRIAGLLGALRAETADLLVEIRTGSWGDHLAQITAGRLDVAFGFPPSELHQGCMSVPAWDVAFGMLVPDTHPAGPIEPISAFTDDRVLIPTEDLGGARARALMAVCAAADVDASRDGRFQGAPRTVAAIAVAVATGCGVGLVPLEDVCELPAGTRLVELADGPTCSLELVCRTDGHSPAVARLLGEAELQAVAIADSRSSARMAHAAELAAA